MYELMEIVKKLKERLVGRKEEAQAKKFMIADMEKCERPREKIFNSGVNSLSNAELLAVLLRSGVRKENVIDMSRRILGECNNSFDVLRGMEAQQLMAFKGIGEEKASTLLAAFEMARRAGENPAEQQPVFSSSDDVVSLMRPVIGRLKHEECWALFLNRRHRLIHKERISLGGVAATVVDPKIVLHKALASMASALVLVHNHPSGAASPGEADIVQTKKIAQAANACDISLLDHIIICSDDYFSFLDNGLMPDL